ncbi:hypothetical protein NUW58_g10736 [Xylaria curta]|uniref:Uncharacterized protein n=1 Tax=Xylaria curta TaxID=42375 RepID=A0ACC1MGM9_9PEZI|nr:hypothetical protein NUW58_g10736 [Xylaria curta]
MGTDDADDGIRTGWICVNLGTIDRDGTESAVVIMTQGRRAEMDLETLWTRALERSLSPPSKPGSTSESRESTSRTRSESNLHPVEKAIIANLHRPSGFPGRRKGQAVGVSPSNQVRFHSTQQPAIPPIGEIDPLSTSSPEELARVLAYDAHQKQRLLGLLRAQLDKMDAQSARAALGEPNGDSQPTPFMELMELAMETLPPTRTWEYRLAVQHKASVADIPRAVQSLGDARLLTEELRVYGIKATRDQYFQLLTCIFYAKEAETTTVMDLALDVKGLRNQTKIDGVGSGML